MSQLRAEDSATIVSMFSRRCTDNSSSTSTSVTGTDQGLPINNNNTCASSELTDRQPPLTEETSSEMEEVPRCPVCGKRLQWLGGDETLLNQHVDECLNRAAVNDLLAKEKQTSAVNSR